MLKVYSSVIDPYVLRVTDKAPMTWRAARVNFIEADGEEYRETIRLLGRSPFKSTHFHDAKLKADLEGRTLTEEDFVRILEKQRADEMSASIVVFGDDAKYVVANWGNKYAYKS